MQVNTCIQVLLVLFMQSESTPNVELDTRQRILTSALEVFLDKGYAAATTRAIAQHAGVNEVTLFRHFGNKLNLVAAIIERFSPVNGLKMLIDESLTGDYHEDLRQISKYIIAGMTEQPDIMPLVLFEAHQIPELRELLESVPRQMFSVLIQYFERQAEAGNVRPDLSPFLIAQSFFFLNASFARTMRYVHERKYPLPISSDAAPEQLLEIFLHGVSTKK
jgi:AcrR family transcriptional regulator